MSTASLPADMRVLIDLRSLQTPSGGRGIGRYTRNLWKLVLNRGDVWGLTFRGPFDGCPENRLVYPGPRRGISWLDTVFLPPLLRTHRISHYHSTAFALPTLPVRARLFLTVHDMSLTLYPEWVQERHRRAFVRTLDSAGRTHRILVDSQATAVDLCDRLPALASRVRVLYPVFDWETEGEMVVPPSLPEQYLLAVGVGDRLKNLDVLMEVPLPLPLVVAGTVAPERRAELLARARTPRAVLFVGAVSEALLRGLYHRAALLVHPSLNEGFGFPPLEALACGTPVLVSRRGSLPEVLGDAAGYVNDPRNPEEWQDALARALAGEGGGRHPGMEAIRSLLVPFQAETLGPRLRDLYLE